MWTGPSISKLFSEEILENAKKKRFIQIKGLLHLKIKHLKSPRFDLIGGRIKVWQQISHNNQIHQTVALRQFQSENQLQETSV